jgi:hypothetical protein
MKRLTMSLVMGVLLAGTTGCARVGYTDRVLHRVPSPDGQLVAVCQEVPVFDGPDFTVRLERPGGQVARQLFGMGDGGGCSEVVWSPDGRSLAVVTRHVAVINIVDVAWAMAHPDVDNRHYFHRSFSFASEGSLTLAAGLRFRSSSQLEFQLCPWSMAEARRNNGRLECSEPPRAQSLALPMPFVANRS